MSGGENKKFIAQKAAYLNSHFIAIDPGNFTYTSPKGVYDLDLKVDDVLIYKIRLKKILKSSPLGR